MEKKQGIGFFEKYLTIWVAFCALLSELLWGNGSR